MIEKKVHITIDDSFHRLSSFLFILSSNLKVANFEL